MSLNRVHGLSCSNLHKRADCRQNMEDKTQHRLSTEMDIALMKAHLRLDISQMMDKQISDSFQRVNPNLYH
jgi:hypothetical protein